MDPVPAEVISDDESSSSASQDSSEDEEDEEEDNRIVASPSIPNPTPSIKRPPTRFPRRRTDHFEVAHDAMRKFRRNKWTTDFGVGILPIQTVMSDEVMYQLGRKQKIFTIDDLRDATRPSWHLADKYGEEVIATLALIDADEFCKRALVRKRKADEEMEAEAAKRRKEEESKPLNLNVSQYGAARNPALFRPPVLLHHHAASLQQTPGASSSRLPLAEQGAGPSRANHGSLAQSSDQRPRSQQPTQKPATASQEYKENTPAVQTIMGAAATRTTLPKAEPIMFSEQLPDLVNNRRAAQKPKSSKRSTKASKSSGSSSAPPPASAPPPGSAAI